MTDTPKRYTKAVLIGFLIVLNCVWTGLAVGLIWQNATKPAYTVESCVEVKVNRGGGT